MLFDNHLKVNLVTRAARKTWVQRRRNCRSAISFNPTLPVYSGNKSFNGYTIAGYDAQGNPIANPVALLNDYEDNSNAQRSIGNLQLDYKFHFLPDLHANLNLGYDVSKGTGTVMASDSTASDYLAIDYKRQGQK